MATTAYPTIRDRKIVKTGPTEICEAYRDCCGDIVKVYHNSEDITPASAAELSTYLPATRAQLLAAGVPRFAIDAPTPQVVRALITEPSSGAYRVVCFCRRPYTGRGRKGFLMRVA